MFMRLMWGKVRPGSWAQYEARYKAVSQPFPGLRSRWLIRDTADPDALYAVGLWDSLDAIRQWESSPHYRDVYAPALKPFLVGELAVSICEVRHTEGV